MVVLLPISRFRVNYELASGQPFSALDRLILRLIGEGGASQGKLVETFHIHPRLVIESVVGLCQAGWVAMGSSEAPQFLLTPEGKAALSGESLPEMTSVHRRTANVLMERVTGALMLQGETSYVTRKRLEKEGFWDRCSELKSEVRDNHLDGGQVWSLLRCPQGMRKRSIVEITMISKDWDFIPLEIGPNGTLVNFPARYSQRLLPYVEEANESWLRDEQEEEAVSWGELEQEAGVRTLRGESQQKRDEGVGTLECPLDWSDENLLTNSTAHTDRLRSVLSRDGYRVLIASRAASARGIDSLAPLLRCAVGRGVKVDLLFGSEAEIGAIKRAEVLAQELSTLANDGALNFNRKPASSSASLLMWVDDEDSLGAVIGCNDWLSLGVEQDAWPQGVVISAHVSHPLLVSHLCQYVGGLWASSRSECLSSVPNAWRRNGVRLEEAAEALENDMEPLGQNATSARLVLGPEHRVLLDDWLATAEGRFFMVGRSLGEEELCRLTKLRSHRNHPDLACDIWYKYSRVKPERLAELRAQLASLECTLQELPGAESELAICDSALCVSSYDMLLGRSSVNDSSFQDIGIVLKGRAPVIQALAAIKSHPNNRS